MTRIFRLAATALVFLSFTRFGFADWDFTKWGMSLNQVVTASGGRARTLTPDRAKAESSFIGLSCQAQIASPYTLAGLSFQKVNFCFDGDGRLQSVDLYTGGNDFEQVDRTLAAAFGAPAKSEGGSLPERIYVDRAKGNSLRLIRVSSTILSYRPIPSGF